MKQAIETLSFFAILAGIMMLAATVIRPAEAMQPLPFKVTKDVRVEQVAVLEDGDVVVYRLERVPDRFSKREICWVTVGELHGKTVTMECNL